jgi:arylsulfatase A-like enzyme
MIVRIPFHRTEHGSAQVRRPAAPASPRPGAPNVLYIVWDEAGIGKWSAFGGLVETPVMKWLAGRGLRYSQWHTNALPSPTRCCLLTGRNPEPAARGLEQSVIIPREAGTLAEILGRNGYRSYCVGQWHHSPQPGRVEALTAEPRSATTARQTWPLGRGFDRYYGFLDRQTSPWYPDLVYDNQHVDPPYAPEDGYHLSRDLVDMAVEFLRDGCLSAPRQPWFCYLSLAAGGAEATPQEWAEMYRGRFGMGHDRYREVVLGNMKRLGIVPKSTALAPADAHPARGPAADRLLVRRWRSLTEEQRRRSSRLAESAAGLCSFTDHEVGRLLQYLEESGQLDDTIVVVCAAGPMSAGDRSPAAGGPAGPLSENDLRAGWIGPDQAANVSSRAGDDADELAAGWAWAFATPYSVLRQDSLGGSAASPLIISWPREMGRLAGGVRDQYHHAVDIVPTILDCAEIDPPQTIKGHVQRPLHGVSMRYTFQAPEAPSARQTQLYQMPAARAIYHAGWKAVAGEGPAGASRWELYRVGADRAETRNVAARYPEKVAELTSMWEAAAGRPAEPAHEGPDTPAPLAAHASGALTGQVTAH